MKYRKKPVVIEAMQYTGDNRFALMGWVHDEGLPPTVWRFEKGRFLIETREGDMEVSAGDWVICGVKGEYYPCKPDIFAATYDPVALTPAPQNDEVT